MPFYAVVEFTVCPRWAPEIAKWKRPKTEWLPEIISHPPSWCRRNTSIPLAWIKDPIHILSRCIVLLKPRLFLNFAHFLFIFSGGSSLCQFPCLVPIFDPHPLKAWALPAVSNSVCLPPSPAGSYRAHLPPASPRSPTPAPCKASASSAGENRVVQHLSKRAGRMRWCRKACQTPACRLLHRGGGGHRER